MDWILFGPPGCGKGTQAERLSAFLDLYHFSTGDVLRENVAKATELGRQAGAIMKRGALVPDGLIVAMARDKLSQPAVAARGGVLFDGFPRTIPQAEALEKAMGELKRRLGGVLALEVDDEEIIQRLSKRGRADDTPETVRARLAVYQKQTAPLLAYYRERGQLAAVDGVGPMEEVEGRLRKAVEGRGQGHGEGH